jgi:hypothetical protein
MQRSRKRLSLIVILAILCVQTFAQEATVYLKTGKELPPGRVLLIESGVLVYKSEFGDLSIPTDQVEQIVFADGTKDREGIVLSTGDWIGGTVTSYRDGIWQIKSDFGQAIITKPDVVTSVNFDKTRVFALKALSRKGVSFRFVVDWLYSTELLTGEGLDEWQVKIEKILFSNNQVIMNCAIKNQSKIRQLNPKFFFEDEFGNRQNSIKSSFMDTNYSFVSYISGTVTFPAALEGSKTITIGIYDSEPNKYGNESFKDLMWTPKLEIADLLAF